MLVEARNLSKAYGASRVVEDVSFSIARGETLGLVGESGSGKSTVARMLLRLIEPSAGAVSFDGTDVLAAPPKELRALRRRMQIIAARILISAISSQDSSIRSRSPIAASSVRS